MAFKTVHPLWAVCLMVRLGLAFVVVNFGSETSNRYVLSFLCALIGLGFLFKAITGSNSEVQLAPVFWHDSRAVHSTLYLLSAFYLLRGNSKVGALVLVLDIVFSILYRIFSKK